MPSIIGRPVYQERGRELLAKKDPSFLGQYRALAMVSSKDMLVQSLMLEQIERPIDQKLSKHSFAFRRRRGKHQESALKAFEKNIRPYPYVLKIDIEKFYYNIDHEVFLKLFKSIATKTFVKVPSWLTDLIKDFLDVSRKAYGWKEKKGIIQGSPLSPLFSNIYLDSLDRFLEKHRVKFVRYCDDVRIFTKTKEKSDDLRSEIEKFINKKLRLNLNKKKSEVVDIRNAQVEFLGFSLSRAGNKTKIRIRKSSIEKFIRKVKRLTRWDPGSKKPLIQKNQNQGKSRPYRPGYVVRQINFLLGYGDKGYRGWPKYFLMFGRRKSALISEQLRELNGIVRRRMRGYLGAYIKKGKFGTHQSTFSPEARVTIRKINKQFRSKGLHMPSDVYERL